jgi:hypothetical protein
MVSRKRLSEQEFLASVRQYWSNYAVARETDSEGKPGRHVLPGGLSENAFYRFDLESMTALRHAIEDMALEEANGRLVSAFGSAKSFEAHRERYTHLAATVEQVEIILPGPWPRKVPHARFVKAAPGACRSYSLTAYEGRRHQAIVIGRHVHAATAAEQEFEGFYSFNAPLIGRLRIEAMKLAAGRLPVLQEFHRMRLIDQVSKQIHCEFAREEEALSAAMQRLLLDGRRYQATHFASDLEQGLSRLFLWKSRVPEILARAGQGS